MASPRARAYLEHLRRVPHVADLGAVKSALASAGVVKAAEVFLDFHARYAGYVEELGQDRAVYGIVHPTPTWLEAGEADVEGDAHHTYVACADAHPSFDFWLSDDGRFLGSGCSGPAMSFDAKIEQDALYHQLALEGRWRALDLSALTDGAQASLRSALELALAEHLVKEASDELARLFFTGTLFVHAHHWQVGGRSWTLRAFTCEPGTPEVLARLLRSITG